MIYNATTLNRSNGRGGVPSIVVMAVIALIAFILGRRSSPPLPSPNPPQIMKIPRILHHVHIEDITGETNPQNDGTYDPSSRIHPEWAQSCLLQYSPAAGWQHMHWNYSTGEAFMKKHAKKYLKLWREYPTPVHRADALRYFLMFYLGGMYVDSDIDCWREGSDMLAGYDVVLQGSQGGGEPATNSAMASAPGHPLWEEAFKMLVARKDYDSDKVGDMTGPQLIGDGLYALGVDRKEDENGTLLDLKVEYEYKNTRIRVYPLGSWFHPCSFSDRKCHTDIALQRAVGVSDLTTVVGQHHFTATWIRGLDHSLGISSTEEAKKEICD